jgi:hypothetical protein
MVPVDPRFGASSRSLAAVSCAGLLVFVTGLGGQAERGGIFGTGVIRLAGGEQHLAEAV